MANVETTSLAILALDEMEEPGRGVATSAIIGRGNERHAEPKVEQRVG
jgi:hypothetical protein